MSRNCSHQLVRHRLASFTQESQRYVDYLKKEEINIIVPESLRDLNVWKEAIQSCITMYDYLRRGKIKPEDARSILPGCVATEIFMTANLREWRHVLNLRTKRSAQEEIRSVMKNLLIEFKKNIPIIFDDIIFEK